MNNTAKYRQNRGTTSVRLGYRQCDAGQRADRTEAQSGAALATWPRIVRSLLSLLLAASTSGHLLAATPQQNPVAATVETTMGTEGSHIRQLAFDGDPATYFLSQRNPKKADSFTLIFAQGVALNAISVTTGQSDGQDGLDAGVLEGSADGKSFAPLAKFAHRIADVHLHARVLRAVRIRPTTNLQHPLAIREITLDSKPAVIVFQFPVEFEVDIAQAPEMGDWASKAVGVCERAYPMICRELASPGFKPPQLIRLRITPHYRGVAATAGTHIIASARYFKAHPNDVGALVHETVHVVQHYRGRHNPGWLVEGVADYIRFFKYEPGKLGRINPRTARYNGSYRVTAAFLAYLTTKYDKNLVRRLNQAMRQGTYTEDLFKERTGKSVQELGEEWKASLQR